MREDTLQINCALLSSPSVSIFVRSRILCSSVRRHHNLLLYHVLHIVNTLYLYGVKENLRIYFFIMFDAVLFVWAGSTYVNVL